MASTGATSEAWGQSCYNLPDIALIDMGDFVGGMVKYMRRHPLPNLSIMGGFGKLVKLGQGAIDLHSARSQVDFNALSVMAAAVGFDPDKVAAANSVLEVARDGVGDMKNMASILSDCRAAIAVPHVTSTGSSSTSRTSAIALPIEMPRPPVHSPVRISLVNQGGA